MKFIIFIVGSFNLLKLKSDYFRIEIHYNGREYQWAFRLKSDYFRIEIMVQMQTDIAGDQLKSDYFRIEIHGKFRKY